MEPGPPPHPSAPAQSRHIEGCKGMAAQPEDHRHLGLDHSPGWGCPGTAGQCSVLSSIPRLHPPDANSNPLPPSHDNKNVSRKCPRPLLGAQSLQLRPNCFNGFSTWPHSCHQYLVTPKTIHVPVHSFKMFTEPCLQKELNHAIHLSILPSRSLESDTGSRVLAIQL